MKQDGAVLLVSLILLMLLTLGALASVDDVNIHTRMARNNQYQLHVYHVALSEITAQLTTLDKDTTFLSVAINAGENNLVDQTDISMQPADFTQAVSLEYTGEGLPPAGYSVNTYVGHLFELDSSAELTNTGISSDQIQGLKYAGPK